MQLSVISRTLALKDVAFWRVKTKKTNKQKKKKKTTNEGVLHVPISSKTVASHSDCLVSYPGHSLGESYFDAEMQSVYSMVSDYPNVTDIMGNTSCPIIIAILAYEFNSQV